MTLALRNAPATFAAGTHDCKRVAKEADSAWLRFGPSRDAFDAASDPAQLRASTVLLWSDASAETERSIAMTAAAFDDFRGHLALDDRTGEASIEGITSAMGAWRAALDRR